MVTVGGDGGALKAADRPDAQAVRELLDVCSQTAQLAGGGTNAVGLLDPELGGVADDRLAAGEAGSERDQGQFVDGAGHEVTLDHSAAEARGAHADVRHGFRAPGTLFLQGNVGTHEAEGVQHARARGVDADALYPEMGVWMADGEDQPSSGGRDIARHVQAQGLKVARQGPDAHPPAAEIEVGAHRLEHTLSVIAAGGWLLDDGLAVSVECGQGKGGLDLGGGDGRTVVDAFQGTAVDSQRRPGVTLSAGDVGAHETQRLNDAGHGAREEGAVAGEDGEERLRDEKARQQPDGGTGVAAVQDAVALG